MAVPTVVIVGRPNVGKSSLFNRMAGRRIAIVDHVPGVTRDRLSTRVSHEGRLFTLVDTGGVGIVDRDDLSEEVERQIAMACADGDVILLVVDVRDGISPYDEEIARRLRPLGRRCLVVVNKVDHEQLEAQVHQFHKLGFEDVIPVSANAAVGVREMLDCLCEALPEQEPCPGTAEGDEPLEIAVVGKRNSGKSTYVNALARQERVIVSEVPGTTRDSVDVHIRRRDREIVLIDTAGMRKRKQVKEPLEFYSMHRTSRSIRRADVVLHLIEAPSEISQVDKDLASYVVEQYKPCIIVVNKMDLAEEDAAARNQPAGRELKRRFRRYVRDRLPLLGYAPVHFACALNGDGVSRPIQAAFGLHEQASFRAYTSHLNDVIREAFARRRPKVSFGRLPKFYFATQSDVNPPTIVLFVNRPADFDDGYRRYLANWLRRNLPFRHVPLRLVFRRRRN